MIDLVLKIKDIQRILGISRSTVYSLIKDKKHPLPMFYITKNSPRFWRDEVEEWIKQREVG